MRGPAPTPTAILKLRGSTRVRKRKGEPVPEVATMPCPEWLTEVAQAEWQRVTAEMTELGTAAKADHAAVEAYCACYARWLNAEAEVQRHGAVVKSPNGYPIQNPYLSIANECLRQLRGFAQELGLSPSARTRIRVDSTPASKLDKYIGLPVRKRS